jgi:hypothetical protein
MHSQLQVQCAVNDKHTVVVSSTSYAIACSCIEHEDHTVYSNYVLVDMC